MNNSENYGKFGMSFMPEALPILFLIFYEKIFLAVIRLGQDKFGGSGGLDEWKE